MKKTNNSEKYPTTAVTTVPIGHKPHTGRYAVQVRAHVEKDDTGNDEIVIQSRTLSGRIVIAGWPFGDLTLGQNVTVRIGLVPNETSSASPVTDNPQEDAFYEKAESDL